MSFELQIDEHVAERILRELVDETLAQIRTDLSRAEWIDRIDRDGQPTIESSKMRLDGMLSLTDRTDVLASPDREPSGPATTSGSIKLEATFGTDAASRPTISLELGTSVHDLSSTLGTWPFVVPVEVALTKMTGYDSWRVGVQDDRLGVFLWSMDDERRIPIGKDWCLAIPVVFVRDAVRAELAKAGYQVEPEYSLEGTTPTFTFMTSTKVQMPDPLPAFDARVNGKITLGLGPGPGPDGNGTWIVAIANLKVTPPDGGIVGIVADITGPFTGSPTLHLRPAPMFAWNGVRMDVHAIDGTADHVVLTGSATASAWDAPGPPTFVTESWGPLLALGSATFTHGLPKSAISQAHVSVDSWGSIVKVETPSEDAQTPLFFIPPPKIDVEIDGTRVTLSASAEAIEAREASMGRVPYTVLVHTTRGHRLFQFESPPHPERDADGGITNALVIPPQFVPIADAFPGPTGPKGPPGPDDPGGPVMIIAGQLPLRIPQMFHDEVKRRLPKP